MAGPWIALLALIAILVAAATWWVTFRRRSVTGGQINFEFGETVASNAFWQRNPKAFPALLRLLELTNKTFGREYRFRNRVDDICFNLGETCRTDFLEVLFLAVNGYGIGAQKLLRGLFERALALEYIRTRPDKAERFVRYAAIQEYKASRAAADVVGQAQFDAAMPLENTLGEQKKRYEQFKGEFEQTDCKTCNTKRVAISWDIDIKSMVNKVGSPFDFLYFACYSMANLHVHATLASAFQDEAVGETAEQRSIRDAEFAVMNAILVFLAVLQSQNNLFQLGLDQDIEACYGDLDVWKDRPHARPPGGHEAGRD
jgi:hypothetical protein